MNRYRSFLPKKYELCKIARVSIFVLLLAATAGAQTPAPPLIQSIPVGLRPMGIGFALIGSFGNTSATAVIANSGENSLSVLHVSRPGPVFLVSSSTLISGITSPFEVTCYSFASEVVLVTSPSDNSVSLVDAGKGVVAATLKVGSKPYSATCSSPIGSPNPPSSVYVSNYGDNSVSIVDIKSFAVTKTISNVPGNQTLHGIDVAGDGTVWVAGTDANVVTVVNPITGSIVATIPVRAPTSVQQIPPLGGGASANYPGSMSIRSSTDNTIYTFDVKTLTLTSTSVAPAPIISGAAASIGTSFYLGQHAPSPSFILATSPDTNSVFLIQAQPSTPQDFGAANAASFGTVSTSPAMLASLFATTGVSQSFNAASVPLPRTLGGVTLDVGGSLTLDLNAGKWNYSSTGAVQAPLLFVGPTQINFQIPPGIAPGGAVPAQLTKPDGTTLLTTLNMTATAPGIFTVLQNGQGQAAVLNSNNSQNFGTNPAARGSFIQIYATGGGDTTPALMPGEAAPASGNPLVLTNVQPTVTIGGQSAQVLFSGMAPGFVGLWQINAQIPQSVAPGNAVPLVINAGGVASNTVTIAVQ